MIKIRLLFIDHCKKKKEKKKKNVLKDLFDTCQTKINYERNG